MYRYTTTQVFKRYIAVYALVYQYTPLCVTYIIHSIQHEGFSWTAAAIFFISRSELFRSILLLCVPLVALFQIYSLGLGNFYPVELFNFNLELMRVDKLSRVFGLIFCVAAFLGNLYAWHIRDSVQQVATLLYTGSAIGAVFSGECRCSFTGRGQQ